MAKVSFSKLNQIKKLPPVVEMLGEQAIEIEQYLPLADKMDLITAVIEQSGNGEEGFFNIVKLEAYLRIEVVQAYTNISFTEKQLSETTKLYDALELNGVWDFVESHIPEEELDYLWESIVALAKEVTDYNNSILGILKAISDNRDGLNFDLEEVMGKLNDPEALTLLKGMVQKTGLTN